jgi:UDP-2,4-diacetamido-2,4,6-trideoxy-beta-L-altropyranose hydrolase
VNIAFRVEASSEVGTGHIYRCLNLAEAFKGNNNQIYFICKKVNFFFKKKIKNSGFFLKKINNCNNLDDDFKITKKIINQIKIDFLIIDNYNIKYSWEKKISRSVKKILVIDDLFEKHYCDYLLNYSFKKYPKKLLGNINCKLLTGPKYTILNNARKFKVKKKKKLETKNLLIFFGGTDGKNITSKIIKILKSDEFQNLNIRLVLGIFNKNKIKIKKNLKLNQNIKLYCNLDNLNYLLSKSDTAIIAGGTVLLEAIAARLKILVINQSLIQSYNSIYLKKKKYLSILKNKKITKNKILKFILKKNNNIKKNIIDYNGSIRIKKILLKNYE